MNNRIPDEALRNLMSSDGPTVQAWRFDGFEFDLNRGELKGRDGRAIVLRPKAELLLRRLLTQPGHLLSRDELMSVLWPDTVVTDDSLVQCMGEVRAALDDRAQRLIRTVPRRGYRLETTVQEVLQPSSSEDSSQLSLPSLPPAIGDFNSGPVAAEQRRRLRRVAYAGAAVLLTVLPVALWLSGAATTPWPQARSSAHIDEEIAARHIFAVMRFATSGAGPELRGLADEVEEQISGQIATWPTARCIGRARTAAFDGAKPSLAQLGKSLGATYVVTGRVSELANVDNEVSIEVQIHSVADGSIVGSEHFDVKLPAGRSWSADIGQQVANLAGSRIAEIDVATATRAGHVPDAADLTLLGWHNVMRRGGKADIDMARARFEQALHDDPKSVVALNGLGAAYLQARVGGFPLTAVESAEGADAIELALKLAPNDASSLIAWGNVQLLDRQADLALGAFEKAIRVTPSLANPHLMRAYALFALGRAEEAGVEAEHAARLAAVSGDAARTSIAFVLAAESALSLNEDLRAEDLVRQAIVEQPSNPNAHAIRAAIVALGGSRLEAQEEMAIFRRHSPEATVATVFATVRAVQPTVADHRARIAEGLRLAGLPER